MCFKCKKQTAIKISVFIFLLFVVGFKSCSKSADTASSPYKVLIQPANKKNAPYLQSFVAGKSGSEWLIWGGRTNAPQDSMNGGLHDMNAPDYSYTAFPFLSFNTNIYVYNVDSDKVWSCNIIQLLDQLHTNFPKLITDSVRAVLTPLFKNVNALVYQDGNTLYVLGGYGPAADNNRPILGASNMFFHYKTYDQIAKINIPTMISLVKYIASTQAPGQGKGAESFNFAIPVQIGSDPDSILVSTGGELFKIGDTFYMAGGHNYHEFDIAVTDSNKVHFWFSQIYVNAVHPFNITSTGLLSIAPTNIRTISDLAADTLKSDYADSTSIFRRRDAPIVPSLNYNVTLQKLLPGITFYTGVFQYFGLNHSVFHRHGKVSPETNYPLPWTDAIYIKPDSNAYFYDKKYYQINNVYSCADFEGYDLSSNNLYTFLMGGIGGGGKIDATNPSLMAFTNNGLQIIRNLAQNGTTTTQLDTNVFNITNNNPFYGAESAMMLNDSVLKYYMVDGNATDVIDLEKTFSGKDSVLIGYIYGGIEAYQQNPGGKATPENDTTKTGYGPGSSSATNKIWKVTLIKK